MRGPGSRVRHWRSLYCPQVAPRSASNPPVTQRQGFASGISDVCYRAARSSLHGRTLNSGGQSVLDLGEQPKHCPQQGPSRPAPRHRFLHPQAVPVVAVPLSFRRPGTPAPMHPAPTIRHRWRSARSAGSAGVSAAAWVQRQCGASLAHGVVAHFRPSPRGGAPPATWPTIA